MKISDEDVLSEMIPSGSLEAARREMSPSRGEPSCIGAIPPAEIDAEIVELVRQHSAALSRYAGTISRNGSMAQDGIQETFLRYFVVRVSGQQVENPRAWLFKVLRNYLLDCKRRDNTMSAVGLESAGTVADCHQDLEAGYQKEETFRLALAMVSPREQECVQLRLEGFGYEEIAQILKIRSGTVAALLARALRKMRHSGCLRGRE